MSQKKVDEYKKKKVNRAKIMKKEKLVFRLEKLAAALVGLAIVCWIGYSVYDRVAENQENVVEETVMDTSALDEYLSSLSAETAEAE